jgi:hypothetical protein
VKCINKKTLVVTVLLAIMIVVAPASAWSDLGCEYVDYIYQNEGTWNTSTKVATEAYQDGGYKCLITMDIYYVDQSADVYKIYLDYDGTNHGFPWDFESLYLQYRWGTSGTWIPIGTLDMYEFHDYITINDATSTILQLRLIDSKRNLDMLQHIWYFGNEPVLWLYWY